jgi:hypothetical protein
LFDLAKCWRSGIQPKKTFTVDGYIHVYRQTNTLKNGDIIYVYVALTRSVNKSITTDPGAVFTKVS